jgi:acetoin utilization deacetylase AcuC-like enzyme
VPLHLWSSAAYAIPLPDGHRFPMAKYALLREGVLAAGIVPPARLHDPPRAPVDDLLLVHTPGYVEQVTHGTLPYMEQRRIGLPWSPAFVERAYRVVRGTCEAAEAALVHGVAMNLAGGTHHAFPHRGEGFCTFNDVAVAVRRLQRSGHVRRACVVDLDVHQGNGTHACFAATRRCTPSRCTARRTSRSTRCRARATSSSTTAPATTRTSRCSPSTCRACCATPRPTSWSTSPAPTRTRATGSGGCGSRSTGSCGATGWCSRRAARWGIPVCVTIAGGYGRDVRDTVRVHVNTAGVVARFA